MWAGQMLQITSQLEHMGVARRIDPLQLCDESEGQQLALSWL